MMLFVVGDNNMMIGVIKRTMLQQCKQSFKGGGVKSRAKIPKTNIFSDILRVPMSLNWDSDSLFLHSLRLYLSQSF